MINRFSSASKLAALSLAVAAAVAMPLSASAHGHGFRGGYYGGGHGGYYGRGHGGYYGRDHDGHWSGGRWIAGALVTGAVIGLVSDAFRPAPEYYGPPVVYSRPRTVIYEDDPVVRRRVIERRTVYEDPYDTRYIRRYDDDDGD